jgi:hypothetical protein
MQHKSAHCGGRIQCTHDVGELRHGLFPRDATPRGQVAFLFMEDWLANTDKNDVATLGNEINNWLEKKHNHALETNA